MHCPLHRIALIRDWTQGLTELTAMTQVMLKGTLQMMRIQ